MRAEHGKIEGNLRVAGGLDLHDMFTETVSAAPGRRLELRGTVCRDLVRQEGSSVHFQGTVWGDVDNRGGELLVCGSSGGTSHREGGTTVIDLDAAIARPIRQDGASGVDRRRPFPTGPSY